MSGLRLGARQLQICAVRDGMPSWRPYSIERTAKQGKNHRTEEVGAEEGKVPAPNPPTEPGAMSRRLSEMTEEAIEQGGRSLRKSVETGGFSDELKQQLEARIKEREPAAFRQQNSTAASMVLSMPASAGQGTRETAAGTPWTGTEVPEDTALRMLDDASKPMRVPFRPPDPRPTPGPINLAPNPKPLRRSPGQRIAEARDRSAAYSFSQSPTLSDSESASVREELRARFDNPLGGRSMPMPMVSPSGLGALANERIDDAIAAGQFRHIKRGKGVGVKRDHVADSPFVDPTEYLMNRMLKNQAAAPPWIERQQGLAREVARFRESLQRDVSRTAVRAVQREAGSSASVEAQVQRAREYVRAAGMDRSDWIDTGDKREKASSLAQAAVPLRRAAPLTSHTHSFYATAITAVNAQARSYNLSAPPVAHKPYLMLERELAVAYGRVLPELEGEVRLWASGQKREVKERKPEEKSRMVQSVGSGGLFAGGTRLMHEDKKRYGLKELWRDMWGG